MATEGQQYAIPVSPAKWLEDSINAGHINFFDYGQFKIIKKIGRGGFGTVELAEWKVCDRSVALKSLNTDESQFCESLKNFVKELRFLRNVDSHPNINRFFGVTREPVRKKYIMVLEYANGGNLRDHLIAHKTTLRWPDKHQMSLEISKGLRYIHLLGVIHKDLHSKNILVHNGKMVIADLGLARHVSSTSESTHQGMANYIDPQCFHIPGYKRDKKSDIYSLGVLMWEISSCRIPYGSLSPCTGVPNRYINIYSRCWEENPRDRPDIETVVEILENIPTQQTEISNPVIFLDGELKESPHNSSELLYESDSVSTPHSSSITRLTYSTYITARSLGESTISQYESSTRAAVLLDEITNLYIDYVSIGSNITKVKFEKWIENHKENLENVSNHLILNKNVRHWEVMVGKFFEKGIGFDKNKKESLTWFKKASDRGDVYGHYNVGNCYYEGFGTCEDAIKYFELAAEKGLIGSAKYMLGVMMSSGHGIDRDTLGAFKLFKEAAEFGHVPAQYWLAVSYSNGMGTTPDRKLALNWFKRCVDSGGYEDAENFVV